jgi:diguanylate cyclase (GGDEF)-like protein
LIDLSLPDARGLEALRQLQRIAPEIPIIVLTGNDHDELAVEAVQEGAQDYLVKGYVNAHLLGRAIRYAIERKRAELDLVQHALHDALTGLPNRLLFLDHLHAALERAKRHGSSVAVLFLDLDRFKAINDSLGHEIGDQVLVEAAKRLQILARPTDTLARFGGDEFLLLLEGVGEFDVNRIAERLIAAVDEPFSVLGHEIFIGLSVGIAFTRAPHADAGTLIRLADQAMYRAKERSSGFEFSTDDMHRQAVRRLETGNELHHAIERGELRTFYQPEIDLLTGQVWAAEALLRWRHPERGLLEPAGFVSLAEETGLIIPIGEWVLEEACLQLKRWAETHSEKSTMLMAVNLSPRQLLDPGLVEAVARVLDSTEVDPANLCLEITESTVAREPSAGIDALFALKGLGVVLALDDFGTGHSSLSTLDDYPIDILKIDRSFVHRLGEKPQSKSMIGAVIDLAHSLELRVVAEGVERDGQVHELRRLGCDAAQGFFFAVPAGPERLDVVLSSHFTLSR